MFFPLVLGELMELAQRKTPCSGLAVAFKDPPHRSRVVRAYLLRVPHKHVYRDVVIVDIRAALLTSIYGRTTAATAR